MTGEPGTSRPGLRLLFVVDSRFPGLGGAEIQSLKLARALRERGVQVDFIAPRVLLEHGTHDTLDGFDVVRIDYPHTKLVGSVVLIWRFGRYLLQNAHRYDAMHVHVTRLLAATAGMLRRRTGLPAITKISGFFEFEGGVLDPRRRFLPVNWLTRRGLAHIDHVQTISRQTAEKLRGAGFREAQILFIPNGIDTRGEPPPLRDQGRFVIGYCGRLRHVKGVQVLVEAFARCVAEHPALDIELRIAGDGETEQQLHEQARRLALGERVVFLGKVDDPEPFFADLDLYVQPSFAEGLPNSVIEAMLAARPVLASDIGGNQDLVTEGDTGWLFPAGDAQRLAERIAERVRDRGANRAVAERGRRKIVEHYGFDRVVDSLMAVYRG